MLLERGNLQPIWLDVGCGTGDLVCDSSKYVDKSIGIDFSRKMIDIASKKIEEKNIIIVIFYMDLFLILA